MPTPVLQVAGGFGFEVWGFEFGFKNSEISPIHVRVEENLHQEESRVGVERARDEQWVQGLGFRIQG